MRAARGSLVTAAALASVLALAPREARADDDFANDDPLPPVPAEPTPLHTATPVRGMSLREPTEPTEPRRWLAPAGLHARGSVTADVLLRTQTFPWPVIRFVGAVGWQFDDLLGLDVLLRVGIDFLPHFGTSVLFTVALFPAFELAAGPTYEVGVIDVSRLLGTIRARFRPSRIAVPRARGGFVLDAWVEAGGTHGC